MLLCKALSNQPNQTMQIERIRKQILSKMKNVTFSGISGNVTIDNEGDRVADYALLDQIDPVKGIFDVCIF